MSATNSKNIFYWAGYVWGIRRIAKKVDGFVTTNGFLKRKLEVSFSKKVAVIPNSLNEKQVGISDELIKEKKKKAVFSIGYFSGSPTHTLPRFLRFWAEKPGCYAEGPTPLQGASSFSFHGFWAYQAE